MRQTGAAAWAGRLRQLQRDSQGPTFFVRAALYCSIAAKTSAILPRVKATSLRGGARERHSRRVHARGVIDGVRPPPARLSRTAGCCARPWWRRTPRHAARASTRARAWGARTVRDDKARCTTICAPFSLSHRTDKQTLDLRATCKYGGRPYQGNPTVGKSERACEGVLPVHVSTRGLRAPSPPSTRTRSPRHGCRSKRSSPRHLWRVCGSSPVGTQTPSSGRCLWRRRCVRPPSSVRNRGVPCLTVAHPAGFAGGVRRGH